MLSVRPPPTLPLQHAHCDTGRRAVHLRQMSLLYCVWAEKVLTLSLSVQQAAVHVWYSLYCLSVCLSVSLSVFPHDISNIYAARITKLDIDMVHHTSWKPIDFGIKGQRSRSRCTKKQLQAWVVALLWVLSSSSSIGCGFILQFVVQQIFKFSINREVEWRLVTCKCKPGCCCRLHRIIRM